MIKLKLDISKAYIIAIKSLLSDLDSLCLFAQNLREFRKAFRGEVVNFFCSPLIASDLKKKILVKAISPKDEWVIRFLYVLIDRNHLHLLHSISHLLDQEEQNIKKIMDVDIYSATPVDLSIREFIKAYLKRTFKKSIQIKEIISPNLIGGIKIVANGVVFDDTLLFHLKQIKL